MAEAVHHRAWPEDSGIVHRIFDAAIYNDVHGYGAATFFGLFTQLCFTLFSIDGHYCIDPQFKCEAPEGSREHINFVPTLLVDFECQHPVFFLQINHPDSLHDDSKHEEADKQMRRRFRDLAPALTIPTLHGVCAFGTQLAFYKYDLATHDIQPPPHVTTVWLLFHAGIQMFSDQRGQTI